MGAGAYLKIGMYSAEIAAAKKYVREKVYSYLTGTPSSTPEEYDAWHKEICLTLSNAQKNFQEYSISRKVSQDKFKNKSGFTVGNAQKFLNMLMKDLYACLSQDSCFLNTMRIILVIVICRWTAIFCGSLAISKFENVLKRRLAHGIGVI